MDRKVVLVVMDGLGIREEVEGNAVKQAETPNLDRLFADYPYTELEAYGEAVGLPEGYIGNSEVGHLHLGAGRRIPQELVRINAAIDDGSFFEDEVLREAADQAGENGGRVHVMGIASDGGVHGHVDHIKALMEFFGDADVPVEVHAFLDGRDVGPKTADEYLADLEATARETGADLGSFMGRYFAMDRDENWERTETAYRALVHGEGHRAESWREGLEARYGQDRNDYFVEPVLLPDFAPFEEGDVVVFANWRKDRARQLTQALLLPDFDRFETADPSDFHFVSMMPYRDDFEAPTVLEEEVVEVTVGAVLAEHHVRELRLSESQKRPHVTYFFDGQREQPFEGMDTEIFKSAPVSAYDEKPEMEAEKITRAAVEAMEDGEYGFVLINYPNGDLVGHTEDLDAAIEAVETVDRSVGELAEAARENGYTLLLTADHGNCEEMVGDFSTSHTLNDVPFCIVDDDLADRELGRGGLVNVAATVLELLDLPVPAEMDASLFDDGA